jgi:type IV secretion system protein VirB5
MIPYVCPSRDSDRAQQKSLCQAQAVKPYQDQANAMDAFDQAKSRISQIQSLMQQINQTQDPKAIAELQARMGAEQAMIQNEQIKMQLYAMAAQAEEKMQDEQQNQINARTWASRTGGKPVQPLTFGTSP